MSSIPPEPTQYDVQVYPLGQSGALGSDQWVEWGQPNPGYVPLTVSFVSGLAVKSLWFPAPAGAMSFYAGDSATGTPFYTTLGLVAELVPIPNDAPVVTITGPSALFFFYASSYGYSPFSAGTPPTVDVSVTEPILNLGSPSAPNIALDVPLAVIYGGSGSTDPSLLAGTYITITGDWPNQTINAVQAAGGVQSVTGQAPIDVIGSAQNPVVTILNPLPIAYGGTATADPYLQGSAGIDINGATGKDNSFQWQVTNTGVLDIKPGAVTGEVSLTSDDDSVVITNPTGSQIDFSVAFPNAPKTFYGKQSAITGTDPSGNLTLGPLPTGTWLLEAYAAGLDASERDDTKVSTLTLSTGAAGGMDGSQYTRYVAAADTITSGGAATPSAALTSSGGVVVNSHASAVMFVFKATKVG